MGFSGFLSVQEQLVQDHALRAEECRGFREIFISKARIGQIFHYFYGKIYGKPMENIQKAMERLERFTMLFMGKSTINKWSFSIAM